MALSIEQRQQQLAEIMDSFKEYSTENINLHESTKLRIIEVLSTHRPVKIVNREYGLSRKLKENHRLIINESEDGTKVREYFKSQNVFHCANNVGPNFKCRASSIRIVNGIIFAPMNHSSACELRESSFVKTVQDLYKQGKPLVAHGLAIRRSRNGGFNQSLPTSMFNELNLSQNNENDTSLFVPSTSRNTANPNLFRTPQTQGSSTSKFARSGVKREVEDDDDCMIIEPTVKKPKTEQPSANLETFQFYRPSEYTLKKLCDKLNIKNINNEYKLGVEIKYRNIPPIAKYFEPHSSKYQNIFACLSLFFTGKDSSCFLIQHVINEAFQKELENSGTKTSEEISQIIMKNIASDEQIEFIAKFLECRIGIYYEKSLKKYGKWDHAVEDVLTFILSFDAGLFSVVLDLE